MAVAWFACEAVVAFCIYVLDLVSSVSGGLELESRAIVEVHWFAARSGTLSSAPNVVAR